MRRLVTLGCSHTYGEGVKNPSKESWPAILSQMLNYELLNLGESGGSNRMIQHHIYNLDLRPDDMVICLWTYPDRYHFFEDQNTHTGLINPYQNNMSDLWFKHFHTSYNEIFDNQTIVSQVNLYLEKLNIENYNLVVNLDFDYYFKILGVNFIKADFTKNYLENFPRGIDKWHMGVEGNKAYAHFIYMCINSYSPII